MQFEISWDTLEVLVRLHLMWTFFLAVRDNGGVLLMLHIARCVSTQQDYGGDDDKDSRLDLQHWCPSLPLEQHSYLDNTDLESVFCFSSSIV